MRWWAIRIVRVLLAVLWLGAGAGFAVMVDSRAESAPARHFFLVAFLVLTIALVLSWVVGGRSDRE